MIRRRPPQVTPAEAALLRSGLTGGWGHWKGGERSIDALRKRFLERTHGDVEEALAGLVDKRLAHEVGDEGKYALTERGFEAAQLAKSKSLEILQDSVDDAKPPVPSWFPHPDQIENASGVPWDAEDDFKDFVVKKAAKNKAIRDELIKRMIKVLERPDGYGDLYQPPQVRKCKLDHNQRIRWRYEDGQSGPEQVTFIDVRSREDKGYSLSQK